MTVGQISVTEGLGKNIASYEFTDSDSLVKELQRIVLSTSTGLEITDGNNNVPTHEQYIPLYEDNTAQVAKVEFRYLYSPEITGGVNTIVSNSPGFVDHVSISGDSGAGGIIYLRDSATRASGTIVKTIYVSSDGVHSINFDVAVHASFFTGIEIDFSGYTGNIAVQVYRR